MIHISNFSCPFTFAHFITGRIAVKWQTVGIKFTHRSKSAFSPCMGNSLHRFIWNLAQPKGTWVRLAVQSVVPRGWERDPQNCKNFHFLVKSRRARANPSSDFYNC